MGSSVGGPTSERLGSLSVLSAGGPLGESAKASGGTEAVPGVIVGYTLLLSSDNSAGVQMVGGLATCSAVGFIVGNCGGTYVLVVVRGWIFLRNLRFRRVILPDPCILMRYWLLSST